MLAVIPIGSLNLLESHLLSLIVPTRNILPVASKGFTVHNSYRSVKETEAKTVGRDVNLAYIPFGDFVNRCFADDDTRVQIFNIVLQHRSPPNLSVCCQNSSNNYRSDTFIIVRCINEYYKYIILQFT